MGVVSSLSQSKAAEADSVRRETADRALHGAAPRPVTVPPVGVEDALTRLVALVDDDLAACNRAIVARMDSPVALIPQLAAHIVAAGGKRLRPLLTLACARLCGYGGIDGGRGMCSWPPASSSSTPPPCCTTTWWTRAVLRRGLASANAVFGNKASVLVGDFLFARAFQLMVEDGSLQVLAILSRAAATIAEGEVLQLVTQNDLSTTEDRYLDVIHGKTAALFAAACQVGAVVADRPDAEEQALADYGMNLGIAFQLVDDALDYAADQATLGKTVGDDFREGKITLPVLAAFAAGDEGDARVLAPHHRGERADRRRPGPGDGADGAKRRHPHHLGPRRPLRRRRQGQPRRVPGFAVSPRAWRRRRLYRGQGAVGTAPC